MAVMVLGAENLQGGRVRRAGGKGSGLSSKEKRRPGNRTADKQAQEEELQAANVVKGLQTKVKDVQGR
jgi:hypothetical protein